MIEGVIFDVDGTLLDSMSIWENLGEQYLRKIGIEAEKNLSRILITMSMEDIAGYIKEKYQLQKNVNEITSELLDTVGDYYYYEAPLKPGVINLLEKLKEKQIPMVAATASEKEHIEAAFKRNGIHHYFRKIFTCSEVGAGKSKPVIYQKACEYLETKPEETYVVEDVLLAIETAASAGFRTIGVYDRAGENDQEEIREKADIYLTDYTNCDWIECDCR